MISHRGRFPGPLGCAAFFCVFFAACAIPDDPSDRRPSDAFLRKACSVGTRPEGITDAFAAEVIELLVPRSEWRDLREPSARDGCVRAILFDFGARGKLVSLQRVVDIHRGNYIDVRLERPEGIRLRHKVEVGTDLRSWLMLRKESNAPAAAPFERTYVLAAPEPARGWLQGFAYFEGAGVKLNSVGPADAERVKAFERLTWRIARRLEAIYPTHLRAIAEGPIFEDNPVLTRPDLPDADLRESR